MLLGNKQALAFEITPVQPTWEVRYDPERAGWVGLAVWVGGENLCRHVMPGSARVGEVLFVPLAPLADWIVRSFPALRFEERAPDYPSARTPHETLRVWGEIHAPPGKSLDDWLDAREGWWQRHFLKAGSDGAQLPDVAFVRDETRLVISWERPRFAGSPAPELLAAPGVYAVSWRDARDALSELAARVAAWLRDADLTQTYAWAAGSDPVREASIDLEEAVCLFTGHSREELMALMEAGSPVDVLVKLGLSDKALHPAESPLPQALRDLPPRLPPAFGHVLRELDRRTRAPSSGGRAWLDARSLARDAASSASTPEEAGYLAADAIRQHLGLGSDPVPEVHGILARFNVTVAMESPGLTDGRMVVGARSDGAAAAIILDSPRTQAPWGLRFEAVRALAHVLLDGMRGTAIGAAASTFTTQTRRRRSGAFAAEFLLPEDALRAACGGVLDAASSRTCSRGTV
jgi:hypothetical protein